MAEWLKAVVLKTIVLETAPGVRIPLPPFYFFSLPVPSSPSRISLEPYRGPLRKKQRATAQIQRIGDKVNELEDVCLRYGIVPVILQ